MGAMRRPFPRREWGTSVPGSDNSPRRWSHLDTCQYTTWTETDVPRVDCPHHWVEQIRCRGAETISTCLLSVTCCVALTFCLSGSPSLRVSSHPRFWSTTEDTDRMHLHSF